jgi:hypothetical protein
MIIKGQSFQALIQALVEVAREQWSELHLVPQITIGDGQYTIAIYGLTDDPEGASFDTWLARLNSRPLLATLGIECPPDSLQTTVQ